MKIRHFYHVYAAGAWAAPAAQHVAALAQAGFTHPVTIGLVGPPADRARAMERISGLFEAEGLTVPGTWVVADDGWEQVTLRVIRYYALGVTQDEAICYAHTKGAWRQSPLTGPWRASMTRHVIGGWRSCLNLIEGDYETAGCHWIQPGTSHPRAPGYVAKTGLYAGNFWWAASRYLAQLSEPGTEYRHQAEEWIGTGRPVAADLLPGWPSVALCMTQEQAQDWQRRVIAQRGEAGEFSCARHENGGCRGPMRWVSISREYLGLPDFMPLCSHHRVRYERQLEDA